MHHCGNKIQTSVAASSISRCTFPSTRLAFACPGDCCVYCCPAAWSGSVSSMMTHCGKTDWRNGAEHNFRMSTELSSVLEPVLFSEIFSSFSLIFCLVPSQEDSIVLHIVVVKFDHALGNQVILFLGAYHLDFKISESCAASTTGGVRLPSRAGLRPAHFARRVAVHPIPRHARGLPQHR